MFATYLRWCNQILARNFAYILIFSVLVNTLLRSHCQDNDEKQDLAFNSSIHHVSRSNFGPIYFGEDLFHQQPQQVSNQINDMQLIPVNSFYSTEETATQFPQKLTQYQFHQLEKFPSHPKQKSRELEQVILHSPGFKIDHSDRHIIDERHVRTHRPSKVSSTNKSLPPVTYGKGTASNLIKYQNHPYDSKAIHWPRTRLQNVNKESPQLISTDQYDNGKFKSHQRIPTDNSHHPEWQATPKLKEQQSLIHPPNPTYNQMYLHPAKTELESINSLSGLGQAIMSNKDTSSEGNHSQNLKVVSVSEIADLLNKLKPLTVTPSEKAMNADTSDDDVDADTDAEDSDGEEADNQNRINDSRLKGKLDRVLPTSHLLGGSVGLVNEGKLFSGSQPFKMPALDVRKRQIEYNSPESLASDDVTFLKSLTSLGSKLGDKIPKESDESVDEGGFYDTRQEFSKPRQDHLDEPSTKDVSASTIPIEDLVDQLMSVSRLASSGILHDRVSSPNEVSDPTRIAAPLEEDDEYEEIDEDDEDDIDNNGTLPLDANESALSITKANPSHGDSIYSSVFNSTDTWIPLNSIMPINNSTNRLKNTFDKRPEAKKTKKRKKKRRKKRNQRVKTEALNQESGIIIGDKRLTRKDLIRLIGILNKMAKNGKTKIERESSRKLLKFLIRLALESHKQIKTMGVIKDANSSGSENEGIKLRESLRSLLLGPSNTRRENDTSIQLHSIMGKRKHEDSLTDSEPDESYSQGNPNAETDRKKTKSFGEISEDLENYFDSDFFEDLADKNISSGANKSKIDSNRPEKVELPHPIQRQSKSTLQLPVSVYGQQLIDAADEDDVELDHVRITNRTRVSSSKGPKTKKIRSKIKRKRTPNQIGRATKSAESRKSNKKLEHKDDESDQDDHEEDEDGEVVKTLDRSKIKPKAKRKKKLAKRKQKLEESESEADTPSKEEAEVEIDKNERDQGNQSAEKEPSEENIGNDSKDDVADVEPNKKVNSRPRSSRRMRGRRKGARDKTIDYISRDDIPAPIAGNKKTGAPKATAGTKTEKSKSKRQLSGSKVRKRKASSISTSDRPTKRKVGHKKAPRSKQKKRRTRPPGDEPTEDKEPSNDKDQDYYNEGTSYSNICDDDGKCQVTVKSNNPDIGKAIETNDEPAIVKSLGKWIENPE